MAGWLPESAGDLPPLGRIGPHHEEVAALDSAVTLSQFRLLATAAFGR
jgi:hypothetical protein